MAEEFLFQFFFIFHYLNSKEQLLTDFWSRLPPPRLRIELSEERMKIILTPFMYLAAIGLILSIIVHVLSLIGMASPLGENSWGLHIGIFVVWLPTVLVANRMVKEFKQKDFWKAALRACPKWMKNLTYFFFGYAILNFVIFIILNVTGATSGINEGNTPTNVFRGFSGHWMVFYCVAMATLYSAIHVEEHDETRRCFNGHPVSPSAKFCEQCGARVIEGQELR